MPTFLQKLLSSVKMPATADDYRRFQSDAEREVERTRAAVEADQRGYEQSLLDVDPAATKSARIKLQDSTDAHARAEARLVKIREEFLRQCEAEAEADRREQYARAQEIRKKVSTSAPRRYQRAADEIRETLVEMAKADIEIRRANADLPAGAEPIPSIEQHVRGLPAIPRKIVDEKVETLWTLADWPEHPVALEHVRLIQSDDGVRGSYQDPFARNSTERVQVVKRRRITREVQPGAGAWMPTPLAGSVVLPGLLPGAPPIWRPVGGDPLFHANDPTKVIEAAEALANAPQSASDPRPIQGWPDLQEVWEDIDPDAEDIAALIAASTDI